MRHRAKARPGRNEQSHRAPVTRRSVLTSWSSWEPPYLCECVSPDMCECAIFLLKWECLRGRDYPALSINVHALSAKSLDPVLCAVAAFLLGFNCGKAFAVEVDFAKGMKVYYFMMPMIAKA